MKPDRSPRPPFETSSLRSPTVGQATVIYNAAEGDAALAAALSRTFSYPALAVRNHDSDILQYELRDAGAHRRLPPLAGLLQRGRRRAGGPKRGRDATAILQAAADDDQYLLADVRRLNQGEVPPRLERTVLLKTG